MSKIWCRNWLPADGEPCNRFDYPVHGTVQVDNDLDTEWGTDGVELAEDGYQTGLYCYEHNSYTGNEMSEEDWDDEYRSASGEDEDDEDDEGDEPEPQYYCFNCNAEGPYPWLANHLADNLDCLDCLVAYNGYGWVRNALAAQGRQAALPPLTDWNATTSHFNRRKTTTIRTTWAAVEIAVVTK